MVLRQVGSPGTEFAGCCKRAPLDRRAIDHAASAEMGIQALPDDVGDGAPSSRAKRRAAAACSSVI